MVVWLHECLGRNEGIDMIVEVTVWGSVTTSSCTIRNLVANPYYAIASYCPFGFIT
jgi:hypothetical protein